MFGYVLANEAHLSKEEHSRLRGFYCGLCRTLKSRYGFSGQLTLSFDMAFLAILLSSLYEPETGERTVRCAVHPKQTACCVFQRCYRLRGGYGYCSFPPQMPGQLAG